LRLPVVRVGGFVYPYVTPHLWLLPLDCPDLYVWTIWTLVVTFTVALRLLDVYLDLDLLPLRSQLPWIAHTPSLWLRIATPWIPTDCYVGLRCAFVHLLPSLAQLHGWLGLFGLPTVIARIPLRGWVTVLGWILPLDCWLVPYPLVGCSCTGWLIAFGFGYTYVGYIHTLGWLVGFIPPPPPHTLLFWFTFYIHCYLLPLVGLHTYTHFVPGFWFVAVGWITLPQVICTPSHTHTLDCPFTFPRWLVDCGFGLPVGFTLPRWLYTFPERCYCHVALG